MATDFQRLAIVEAFNDGRLTGTDLRLDGKPLEQTGTYRPDGWSVETKHGCRRHRDVDDKIREFRESGDPLKAIAADQANEWFCASPNSPIAVDRRENEAEWLMNVRAYNRQWGAAWAVIGNPDKVWQADFWLYGDGEPKVLGDHAVLMNAAGDAGVMQRVPGILVDGIQGAYEQLVWEQERAEQGIVPPGASPG